MSLRYATMDHAAWAERHIIAAKNRLTAQQNRRTTGYATAPDKLSPLQATVMNIIGIVGGGIYNAPIVWDSIRWNYSVNGVAIPWRGNLSTFDFSGLSELVFLCQTARIRCNISPHAPKHLLIGFWQRAEDGGMNARHPNAEQMYETLRKAIPMDHPIVYPGDRKTPDNNNRAQEDAA